MEKKHKVKELNKSLSDLNEGPPSIMMEDREKSIGESITKAQETPEAVTLDSQDSREISDCNTESLSEIVITENVDDNDESIILDEGPEVIEEIESNWQCGECAVVYNSEQDVNDHMEAAHIEISKQAEKIIYLTPENCKECNVKDRKIIAFEEKYAGMKAKEKELELLKIRHDQLKENILIS